jgi:hypothetical protein
MSFDAQTSGTDRMMWVIHIWPSLEVEAQSWAWTPALHASYLRVVRFIAVSAASCLLDGDTITTEDDIDLDFVTLNVRCEGTTVYITITDFAGSDNPDPNGGTYAPQPHPADGLVVRLSGSGKSFRLAVFYGTFPQFPETNILNSYIPVYINDPIYRDSAGPRAELRPSPTNTGSNPHYMPLVGKSSALLGFGPENRTNGRDFSIYPFVHDETPDAVFTPSGRAILRTTCGDPAQTKGKVLPFSTGIMEPRTCRLSALPEMLLKVRQRIPRDDYNPTSH